MKLIPLTQGKYAMVDDEDYERVNQYKWHVLKPRSAWYAKRSINNSKGSCRALLLHRFILGLVEGDSHVDHIDHNGLNNQKGNLRIATNQQNLFNQKPTNNGTSRYKGVCWNKSRRKWQSEIGFNGKKYYLGCRNSEIECAKAYDHKALEFFGEYAYLNFPA